MLTKHRIRTIIQQLFLLIVLLAVTVMPLSAFAKKEASSGVAIEHWQMKNGARVYFVAAPELPMIDIRVVFDAGSAHESTGGVALLTNALLNEGADNLNALAIAKRFEDVGARYSASSHRDMAVVSLRSLSEKQYLDPALETFALILKNPTYPADNLERERKRLFIALQAQQESLEDIAENAFFKAIYNTHPYAYDPYGTLETAKQITRDDIVKHHAQYYVAKNAVIAIVGAVTRKQAESIAERAVGQLPEGTAAATLPKIQPLKTAQTIKIDHPSQQTHILVGQQGMRRGDPDYFPLYVGNHILGGSGLISRLADEIREKRGLSYSQYSYFSPMRLNGPYTLGLQTRNDQAEQALVLLKDLLKTFIKQGPTEEELKAAKQNITGSFPLRISSNNKIVEYLAMIGFYDLPLDYLDTFNANVDAVTSQQIREAFQRRINPNKLVTIIAGGKASTNGEGS